MKALDKDGLSYLWEQISNSISDLELRTPKVLFDTKANWDGQVSLMSEENTIYVYKDYMKQDGEDVAGIKVGDGKAYLIDLPFLDAVYKDHINNTSIHITDEEREFWNNKVRCYYSLVDDDTVIFTTD